LKTLKVKNPARHYYKTEFLEDIVNDKNFYKIYKTFKRSHSPLIERFYDVKSIIGGMFREMKYMLEEDDIQGISLKGIGVLHIAKKAEYEKKEGLFQKKEVDKNQVGFHLEDEYLRNRYLILNTLKLRTVFEKVETRPEAIMLHRKTLKR